MYIACLYVFLYVHVWVHMYMCSHAYRGQRTTLDAIPKVPIQIELWDSLSLASWPASLRDHDVYPTYPALGLQTPYHHACLIHPPSFLKHEFWGSNSNDFKTQILLQAALVHSCPWTIHLGVLYPKVTVGLICGYLPYLCDQKLQESSKSKKSANILFTGKLVFP